MSHGGTLQPTAGPQGGGRWKPNLGLREDTESCRHRSQGPGPGLQGSSSGPSRGQWPGQEANSMSSQDPGLDFETPGTLSVTTVNTSQLLLQCPSLQEPACLSVACLCSPPHGSLLKGHQKMPAAALRPHLARGGLPRADRHLLGPHWSPAPGCVC